MRRIFLAVYLALVAFLMLDASGVIPPVIPQLAPAANKQGNSTKFQLAGTNSGTLGNVLCNDASGNTTDSGCSGAAVSTPFSSITTGNNVAATMTCGAGCAMLTSSTGTITVNGIRSYTVAGLPTATTGAIAYVTDGASASDCTSGSGSTKVLCIANGAAFVAVGSSGASGSAGGALAGTYPNPTLSGITYTNTQNCIPFGLSTAGQIGCSTNASGYNIYFDDTANSGSGQLALRGNLRVGITAAQSIVFGLVGLNGIAADTGNGAGFVGASGNLNLRCNNGNVATVTEIPTCALGATPSTTAALNIVVPTSAAFGGGAPGVPAIVATSGTGSAAIAGQDGGGMTFTTGGGGNGSTSNGSGGNFIVAVGVAGAGAGTAGINGAFIYKIGSTEAARLDDVGHWNTSGTAPTPSSCGTGSPSVSGDDNTGTITTGTGAPTACTLAFAQTWNAAPACIAVTSSTTALASVSAVSTSGITFTLAAGLTSGSIYYQCRSHR